MTRQVAFHLNDYSISLSDKRMVCLEDYYNGSSYIFVYKPDNIPGNLPTRSTNHYTDKVDLSRQLEHLGIPKHAIQKLISNLIRLN